MEVYFKDWKKISFENATVDFYEKDDFIGFDSRNCMPPEPMINARVGLNNLKPNQKLMMINHINPLGLLPSVKPYFDIQTEQIDGGFKLIFTKKQNIQAPEFDESAKDHG